MLIKSTAAAWMLWLLAAAAAAQPADKLDQQPLPSQRLVLAQEGTLPVVVSCPHGGREQVPGVAARVDQGNDPRFVNVRDENTAELAEALATSLQQRLGGKPYLVVAQFERKYIDANRSPERAYDSNAARPYYEAYHDTLARFCREVQNRWHTGLLLDIHGQSSYPDSLLRGTNNTRTVRRLLERHGRDALTGPDSIFGVMEQAGYATVPKCDSQDRENPRFDGGYIVTTYGSHQPGGLDALQLEFGRSFRATAADARKSAGDLAIAVERFARKYLPAEPVKPPPGADEAKPQKELRS